VVVTGMVSRLEALAYLPLTDIFAIPSLHDGCPNAMLEAMLASRAIVGSSADAIGEILVDGENGWVVAPASTSELAEALRLAIARPDLRSQVGRAARQTVLTKLSPAVERQNWQRVYERVLGKTSVPTLVSAAA
ncbi:MAG: glycosyltransferase family 4 protein, partial [Cyanobacteria bacterium J06639_1]